jgi:putative flippase GtrA
MPPLGTVLRFGVVGVAATLTYLGLNIYALRPITDAAPAVGNALAQGLSLLVSYLGHKYVTFRSDTPHRRDLVRFLLSTVVAVLACSLAFEAMVGLGLGVVGASLVVAVLYPAISFVLHFAWTFRAPAPSRTAPDG